MEAHEVLGVPKDASEHQIRVAYKALAMKWHPDRQPHNREEATAKFVEINRANRTMLRNLRRARRTAQNGEGTAVSDESRSSSTQSTPQSSPQSTPRSSPQSSPNSTPQSSPPSSPKSTSSSLPECSSDSTHFSSRSNSPTAGQKSSQAPSVSSFPSTKGSTPRSSLSDESGETRERFSSRSPKSSNPSFENVSSSHTSSSSTSFSSSPKPTGNKLRKKSRSTNRELDPETSKATPKAFPRQCNSSCGPECTAETLRPARAGLRGAGAGAPKKWVHVLNMTLEEIYHGKTCHFRVIRYTRSGKKDVLPLDVHVPPGSRGGTEIILEGVGNELKDGTWQDISFMVKEIKHDRFRRVHDDLVMDVRLPWVDSLNDREGKVYLQGLDQTEYLFNVDYHSTRLLSGTAIIMGAGMHCRDGAGRGRIVVRWEISTPLSSWDSIKNVLLFRG